jgi:hypothetical protein
LMSKTKHKYNNEDDYGSDEAPRRNSDRIKQKRLDRALKTKNIDELLQLDDDGEELEDVNVYVNKDPWFEDETS